MDLTTTSTYVAFGEIGNDCMRIDQKVFIELIKFSCLWGRLSTDSIHTPVSREDTINNQSVPKEKGEYKVASGFDSLRALLS